MTRSAAAKTHHKKAVSKTQGRRIIAVTNSAIHGRGVVAVKAIAAGQRIIEYKGERIGWPEALRRHPHDPAQSFHTFYFTVDDDTVIDGNVAGNTSRWINHSCAPNCEADLVDVRGTQRVFISALHDIAPGEELSYDYGLTLDERYTQKLKKQFECRCGQPKCRGTMLAPKR